MALMKIRFASVYDIPKIIELGRQIHAESRMARLPYDEGKLAGQFKSLLDPPRRGHCIFVADAPNGGLACLMIGHAAEYLFSDVLAATNYVVYVKPEYRGASLAFRLLGSFGKWAQNRGTKLLLVSQTSRIQVPKFDRFMTHIGLQYSGANFSLWLDKGEGLTGSDADFSGGLIGLDVQGLSVQRRSPGENNIAAGEDRRVRFAQKSDLPGIIEIGKRIHAESPMGCLAYSPERFAGAAWNAIGGSVRKNHCVVLAENEDGIAGMLMGYVKEHFFSRARAAAAYAFYLAQNQEGAAKFDLISAFQKWALNRDADEVSVSINTGIYLPVLDQFMRETGFDHTGGNYFGWVRDSKGRGQDFDGRQV